MRRILTAAAITTVFVALSATAASAIDPIPHYRIRVCTPDGACDIACETTDVCVDEYPGDPVPRWCVHWDVYSPDHDIVCVGGNDIPIPPDVGPLEMTVELSY